MNTSAGKRSPLRERPLRQAGTSGRAQIDDEAFRLMHWIMFAVVLLIVAITLWIAWYWPRLLDPRLFSPVFLVAAAFAAWRVYRVVQGLRRLALGVGGEMAVADVLEELRGRGYRVFHDLLLRGSGGQTFNIDHILVGPAGVFAIETKAISKPDGRNAKVTYDGKSVRVDGHTPDRDPVAQARGARDAIRRLIREGTAGGVGPAVRGVVLYPGWWVESSARSPEIWVLNPGQVSSWLRTEERTSRLNPTDAARVAALISDKVRACGEVVAAGG